MNYALVTGASSGIGWHISLELAIRGYSIIAVSNQPENLQKLKSELEQNSGIACIPLNKDLTEPGAAEEVYMFCRGKDLQPEILVNNAGILAVGEFASQDRAKVDGILALHINVLTQLCYRFANDMKQSGRGYILNVSSISSVMAFPVISLYGPSKTYIRAFTKSIRSELWEYNIIVSCLIPGATNTPLNDQLDANVDLAIKLGVMMQPNRVAKRAIHGLFKNKAEIVPGLINKLTLILIPLVPRFIVNFFYRSSIGKSLRK